MFGRRKRTDAPDAHTQKRSAEAIITAATEPVLPPPPAPTAGPPPAAPVTAAPPPPPPPAPPAPEPAAAPPAADLDDEPLSPADIRARTLLADSIARMELSLKAPPLPPGASGIAVPTSSAAVEALADSVARTASEVARALEHVSAMCAMLSERLDADREERRALTEAIARLGVTVPDTPSTVLGGTVYPAASAPEPEAEPEAEPAVIELESAPFISLVDEPREPEPETASAERPDTSFFATPPAARERDSSTLEDDGVVPSVSMFASPPTAREPEDVSDTDAEPMFTSQPAADDTEVISIIEDEEELVLPASDAPTEAGMWCRDDDQWIGGVEIADFISDNGTIRYWLRRTSDGQMLPRPFDATDLRFIRETSEA